MPYVSMGVTIVSMLIVVLRFSRETKDRLRSETERSEKDNKAAEERGITGGRRIECEERMKISIDSAHNKIRSIEAAIAAEKQRQSEQFTEMNAKLDNLTSLVVRIENDIVRRLEKVEGIK